jgi:hypothetical protein
LIDTPTSDRCDNAKLGKMRSDRIDHLSLLTDEEMARAWFTRANSLPMPIEARAPEEQDSGNKWRRQGADPI